MTLACRIAAVLSLTLLVGMTAGLGPVLAQETPPQAPPDDVRKEVEALRREIEELRAWKARMEAEAAAAERRDVEGRTDRVPPPSLKEPVDDILKMEKDDPGVLRLPGSLNLTVGGELRVRSEYRWNLYAPNDPDGDRSYDWTHMRTRLRFDLEVEDDIDAVVELQDVRTFGDEESTIADTEGVDLKRGKMMVSNLFDEPLSLELGRFVLAYGDHRLIGDLEWFDPGRTYDGFRISYGPEGYFADLFGARIRDDAIGEIDVQDLLGLYAGIHEIVPTVTAEGYALLYRDQEKLAGEQDSGNTQFVTLGTRLDGGSAGFDYTGEIAFQTGDVRSDDLSAWAAAVMGGYTIEDSDLKPRFGVEVDYASGNKDLDDGDTETFQTLFPTNHRHYGYADLLGWSNMFTMKAGVSIKPSQDLTVSLDGYNFRLADASGGWINAAGAPIRPGDEDASEDLGRELDLLVKWQATKSLSVLAGWSHFFPGDFVKDTGEDPDADFVYVQAHLKF